MNAFASYGNERARKDKAPSLLDKKMAERQRLSKAYRIGERVRTREVLASEPRLSGFLRYLRTVSAEMGDELVDAIAASDWLMAAPQSVRLFALKMVMARCDHLNRRMGFVVLDDELPEGLGGPPPGVYQRARDLLHAGGRA